MSPFSKGSPDVAKVLGETRWRILVELCRRHMTASELANAVRTSASAVRVHLDAMEDAGLVTFIIERGRVGKPTHVYSVTGAAESLLSKAYAPALAAVLTAACERLNGGCIPMVREAGEALARSAESKLGGRGIERAKALLDGLGVPTEVVQGDGGMILRAACCPLGSVTRNAAEMCSMLEAAVSAASGLELRQHCIRGTHPQCEFRTVVVKATTIQ
jgi:predicted ArsR family transcriptional regulator